MFRKFNNNKCTDSLCSLSLLLIVVLCICSCTSEYSIFDNDNTKLLNFSVSVPEWKNNDSTSNTKTRATPISGSSFDKASSFNIIADAYDGKSSYNTIIKDEAVSFTNNIWQTTAPHYWSGTATNTVSFYACYPTSISSSITHTAGSAPTFSYTVPDDATNQIDIMTATETNVSGNTNSSTPLTFNHIFAAIQFSVGSNGLGNGTISSISIGNVYNSGTYTLGTGWTLGTSMKTFTINQPKNISGTSGEDIYSGTYTLMMIPQTVKNATITINYSNGGTLTKTISGTWEAGKTYNYKISFMREYNYTGNIQSFTVPISGTYKLEVWGAQSGGWGGHINAPGGYAGGYKKLTKGDVLYIVVGGKGYDVNHYTDGTSYNGGGTGYISQNEIYGGGGATHIATHSGCLKDLSDFKSTILLVGGGAGSNGGWAGEDVSLFECGGGEVGLGSNTIYIYWIDESKNIKGTMSTKGNTGGTQTGVGPDGIKGGFGYGGNTSGCAGAGGGGWYGGNASGDGGVSSQTNGGGGSGYIGGVDDGSFQTGVRYGNGYARITFVSAN
ncbi:fimbrillin family protein [Xylanibacter oryzae]|uniref:fimbrillin family protein n=1 Tax=Xylanibacter oryzae TaxID=185293 RepID=UPI0004B4DB2C|nr:fimbrillin family protein [Xylanibacter oryzae]